jgi:aspartyl-tRNA(Asn)/glutamyl-tRNA(Gln) amidotransferase subunit A
MDDELRYATADELRRWYARGQTSPTEVVRLTLELLDAHEPRLHAFRAVAAPGAGAAAARPARLVGQLGPAAYDSHPLLGLPVTVKDLTPTAGIATTRGSLEYVGWVPDRDAPSVRRLRAAGAIVIGKTNTSEGGWSAGTVNRLGPPTTNPWDHTRSPGGSSGGAAAATAAGIGVAALGTDGAGSIRIPAAFCGVVGFKPTFGRIPYVPVSPEGLSHLGPLARDVATAALLAGVMAGPHPDDPFSRPLSAPVAQPPQQSLRIGWLRWPPAEHAVPEVETVARDGAYALAELGHDVEELDAAFEDPYPHLVTILAAAEAAGQKAETEELADPARLSIVRHGRTLSAADLMRAQARRLALAAHLNQLMRRFDVLAMPTVWIEPFAADAWRPDRPSTSDDLGWLAWCRAAYPFNLSGAPAISVPAGFTQAGYPVGLQLVGRPDEDLPLLRVAQDFELVRPWRHHYSRKDR